MNISYGCHFIKNVTLCWMHIKSPKFMHMAIRIFRGYWLSLFFIDTIYPAQRQLSSYWPFSIHVTVFLCSKFFIISQVTVTTTTPPVIVLCSDALTTTMAIKIAAAFDQNGLVLQQSPLIPMDTVRGVVGSATVPQQQPEAQMPSQTWANLLQYLVSTFRFWCGQ